MRSKRNQVKLIEEKDILSLERSINAWVTYYDMVSVDVSVTHTGYLAVITYLSERTIVPEWELAEYNPNGRPWYENLYGVDYRAQEWDVSDKFKKYTRGEYPKKPDECSHTNLCGNHRGSTDCVDCGKEFWD